MNTEILNCNSISLSHKNIPILKSVSFSLNTGELHVILGENGSGKTSLINTISGIIPCEQFSGDIRFENVQLQLHSQKDALSYGIVTLHQDTELFDNLTVADNLFPDAPIVRPEFRRMKRSQKYALAKEILASAPISVKAKDRIQNMNPSEQRMVEIIRLPFTAPKLLILDEPLVGLDASFISYFCGMIRNFKEQGISIIYITHNLNEIAALADRFSILRDGVLIDSIEKSALNKKDINKLIWGDFLRNRYPKIYVPQGKEVLYLEHVSNGNTLHDISLSLCKGEILGITGLVGSGRSMLAKTIFGLSPYTGKIYIDRLEATIHSPKQAISYGLAYVTDARIEAGLFMNQTALENAYSLGAVSSRGFIRKTKFEHQQFRKYCSLLNLSIDESTTPHNMSGGEQQKVLLMRWLMTPAKIFIFDEPTQSIDIAAKVDTYNIINDLIVKGGSVILISSNLEELSGVCDRIVVLKDGAISREMTRTREDVFEELHSAVNA